jgi:hypothetical protein
VEAETVNAVILPIGLDFAVFRCEDAPMSMLRMTVSALLLGAAGCLSSGTNLTRERASFDLGCPADKIAITQLSGVSERGTGSVFGARGCGKKATYIRHEAAGVSLNSPIQPDEQVVGTSSVTSTSPRPPS